MVVVVVVVVEVVVDVVVDVFLGSVYVGVVSDISFTGVSNNLVAVPALTSLSGLFTSGSDDVGTIPLSALSTSGISGFVSDWVPVFESGFLSGCRAGFSSMDLSVLSCCLLSSAF